MPGIIGFAKACELAKAEMESESARLTILRDRLIKGLTGAIPDSFLNGHPTKRLPNNASIRFLYIEGESLILNLETKGVSVSSGSACASKTLEPSHVLMCLGLPHEEAHGTLQFTLNRSTTEADIDHIIAVMPEIVKRLRQMSPITPEYLLE
jgi:cysteine desulfurase